MITREKMAELDKRAIEGFGILSIVLMENAAVQIFQKIRKYKSFAVFCGSGNNGGDGLALARHLILAGKEVKVFLVKEPKTEDAKLNLEIIEKFTQIHIVSEKNYDIIKSSLRESEITVDCIFGNGLSREIGEPYFKVISLINEFSNRVVAVDIPSGIDANTGKVLKIAVKADESYAIHDVKVGMVNNPYCGKIEIVKIGIPDESFSLNKR